MTDDNKDEGGSDETSSQDAASVPIIWGHENRRQVSAQHGCEKGKVVLDGNKCIVPERKACGNDNKKSPAKYLSDKGVRTTVKYLPNEGVRTNKYLPWEDVDEKFARKLVPDQQGCGKMGSY